MALFGPPPVRREFADRLGQLLSAYPHRFNIKPGIMGWSQANLPGSSVSPAREAGPVPDESLRLGYDLYYAKEESPSLDLDIFLRSLFGAPLPTPGASTSRREAAGHF
jgi:lipopolysaccharide/colanic/teichoic acid biosynthesis glycosyltransferase